MQVRVLPGSWLGHDRWSCPHVIKSSQQCFSIQTVQGRCQPRAMHSGVAQWLACWAHNPKVRGSKPRSATFLPRRSRWDCSLTTTIPFLNQSGNHSSAHSCKFSAIHHHAHVYLPSMAACQSRCRIVVSTCMAPCQIRCSIVVSISACHVEDPGSIPGGQQLERCCCHCRWPCLLFVASFAGVLC